MYDRQNPGQPEQDKPVISAQEPPIGVKNTMAQWLYERYGNATGTGDGPWEQLHPGTQAYWEHEARAVERAVARGGFKPGESS